MYMFRVSISFYDVAIQFRLHVMVKSNSLKGVYKFCNTSVYCMSFTVSLQVYLQE